MVECAGYREAQVDQKAVADETRLADLWERLGAQFDRRALDRLEASSPEAVAILRDLVKAGADPDEVRRFARRSGALAPWESSSVEAATRAIYRENLDSIPTPGG